MGNDIPYVEGQQLLYRERRGRRGQNYTHRRKTSGTKCQVQKGEVGPCPSATRGGVWWHVTGVHIMWREGETMMSTARNLAAIAPGRALPCRVPCCLPCRVPTRRAGQQGAMPAHPHTDLLARVLGLAPSGSPCACPV